MATSHPCASPSASLALLASNNARAMHSATKKSAQKAPTFTRHRISSRSVRKNRAIKEPSDVTEKISDVKESPSSSSVLGTDDDGEKGDPSTSASTVDAEPPGFGSRGEQRRRVGELKSRGEKNGASLFRFYINIIK